VHRMERVKRRRNRRQRWVTDDRQKMLADLARLCRIPETRRDEFCNFLVVLIIMGSWHQWEERGGPENLNAERAVLNAAAKIRAACNAVNALRDNQIPDVEGVTTYDEDALDWADDPSIARAALNAIDRAFGAMIDRPSDQRGKKGAIIYPSFQRLVIDFWRAVEAHHGRLTYSNNEGRPSGTIVDALRLLQPHLPPTFRVEPTRSILENAKKAVRRKRPGRVCKLVGPYTSLL
jgi:hypothetical protein